MKNVTTLQAAASQYADRVATMTQAMSASKVRELSSTIVNAVRPLTVSDCPAMR
ncbi:MAG TPA: hypothetical protein VM577_21225 [Anaerovoracaceae bacterium]|nr:hypothetical protein [Anaerovoracaceae bacterium]